MEFTVSISKSQTYLTALSEMLSKPPTCDLCRFGFLSSGFCLDAGNPETATIAFMVASPSSDDLLQEEFWAGKNMKYWDQWILRPAGIRREEVLVCGTIRCRGSKGFPTGPVASNAVKSCRTYDDKLRTFAPTLALCTYSLADTRKTPAMSKLLIADLKKTLRLRDRGYRPVVLMGKEPVSVVFPQFSSLKRFRGHFEELEGWPF